MKVGPQNKTPISQQEAAKIEKDLKAQADKVTSALEGRSSGASAAKPNQDKPVKNNEGSQKQSARLHEMLHGKSKQPVISERLSKTPSSKTSIDSKRVSALVAKSIDGKTEAAKPATPAAASTQGNFLFNSKLRMKALQAGHGRFNQSMGQWELNGKHTAKPATVRTTPGAYAKPQVAGKTFHQAPTQQIPRS